MELYDLDSRHRCLKKYVSNLPIKQCQKQKTIIRLYSDLDIPIWKAYRLEPNSYRIEKMQMRSPSQKTGLDLYGNKAHQLQMGVKI